MVNFKLNRTKVKENKKKSSDSDSQISDTNEKFAHMSTGLGTTNSVVEQVMQEIDEIKRKKDVLFENLRKEMNGNYK